jgi:hypothetical protein
VEATVTSARRRALAVPVGALLAGAIILYWPFLQGMILAGRDAASFFIPNAVFLRDCLRDGHLPLWIPYPRLGQPFLAALQTMVLNPVHLLSLLLVGPYHALTLQMILHTLIAAAGTFWAARRLGASLRGAGLAGAAFPLSPLFAGLGTQANVVGAMAWSGWIVGSAVSFARRPSTATAAPLAFFVALSFTAGSPETLLWQLLLALLASFMAGGIRGAAALPLPLAWGAGLAGALLLPALEYARLSAMVEDWERLRWSASPIQLLSFGWPFADMPRDEYWGADQSFIPTLFVGSLIVLLAILATVARRRLRVLAAGGGFLGMLGLGAHFLPSALLLSLPPLSLFRYPAKYLTGFAFCLALLAAFGLDRAVAAARRSPSRSGRAGAALLAAIALASLALLFPGPSWMRWGVWFGLPGLALAVGLASGLYLGFPRVAARRGLLAASLTLVVVAELLVFPFLWNWREFWTPAAGIERPSKMAPLLASGNPLERINLPLYYLQPKALSDSRDLLLPNSFFADRLFSPDGYGLPEPDLARRLLVTPSRPLFDLLGVAWYVRPKSGQWSASPGAPPPIDPDLRPVPTDVDLPALYRSVTAYPRSFMVHRAVVADDRAALAAVHDPSEPTRETVYLSAGSPLDVAVAEPSLTRIVRYEPNLVEVEILAAGEGFCVLTDMAYPGWRADLDGAPAPIIRADFAMRAVAVPQGHHRLLFRYRPASVLLGTALSLLSLAPLGWLGWRRLVRRAGRGG